MIRVKRVYHLPTPDDGLRFLVDRLWPRGVKKEDLPLAGWLKELAPSDELRRWFAHDPARWEKFRRRYATELEGKAEAWHPLLELSRQQDITLLYGARDTEHNNAVALRFFLEERISGGS